jgi:polyisoprenoid-binding protein YceI
MRGPRTLWPRRWATTQAPDLIVRALAIVMLAALPAGALAAPTTFALDPGGSDLAFYATSRLMNAQGRFHRFQGRVSLDRDDLTTARVTFSVETASLDTANRLRDDHLRSEDFFAVARFPTATFESDRVERSPGGLAVAGRLTIRGVTQAVSIPVQVDVTDQTLRAKGEFELQRTSFGIAYQSRLNPVGDIVRVVFNFSGRPVQAGASAREGHRPDAVRPVAPPYDTARETVLRLPSRYTAVCS